MSARLLCRDPECGPYHYEHPRRVRRFQHLDLHVEGCYCKNWGTFRGHGWTCIEASMAHERSWKHAQQVRDRRLRKVRSGNLKSVPVAARRLLAQRATPKLDTLYERFMRSGGPAHSMLTAGTIR